MRTAHARGNWIITIAAFLLLATALVKLVSIGGSARMLDMTEPVFGLKNRHLMSVAAFLEIAVGIRVLMESELRLKALLIAGLSLQFLLYRLALWAIGGGKGCGCLGNAADWIGISGRSVDLIAKIILLYLLVGSITLLFLEHRQSKRRVGLSDIAR